MKLLQNQLTNLRDSYNSKLNDYSSRLENVRCLKQMQVSKDAIPVTKTSISLEDALLNEIKNSKEFKNTVKMLRNNEIKNMTLNIDVDKKKVQDFIVQEKTGTGTLYTRPVDTNHLPSQEIRERVDESMKSKSKEVIRDGGISGYTFQEQNVHQKKKEEWSGI
ncbi:MAG: hypothetical protein NT038_08010 [Euryarchaeota archaeon]|nr:hypothetical protein [Euryarchaeota archaeon]